MLVSPAQISYVLAMSSIHVGIGGWNFAPWRGTFYPADVSAAKELAFASRAVTSLEINSTFYGSQKPESFRKWRDQSPDGFVFSVKGPRFTTNRRDLSGAEESIERFVTSGIRELGDKLGPVLWQFPPTRQFDADALRPFLAALPTDLRHVVEARHPSFADPAWIALLREFGVAHAIVESDKHTMFADLTAPFIYARLERNALDAPEGYDSASLDQWAERIRRWSTGDAVTDLHCVGPAVGAQARPCFIYFISGDKVRAPDSARAMLKRLAA